MGGVLSGSESATAPLMACANSASVMSLMMAVRGTWCGWTCSPVTVSTTDSSCGVSRGVRCAYFYRSPHVVRTAPRPYPPHPSILNHVEQLARTIPSAELRVLSPRSPAPLAYPRRLNDTESHADPRPKSRDPARPTFASFSAHPSVSSAICARNPPRGLNIPSPSTCPSFP